MKNIKQKQRASRRIREKGSALIYILIAIALLAALTVSFMEPSSQQTSSQNSFKTAVALQGQVDIIRSAIQECVLSYPKGDKCIDNGSGGIPGYCDAPAGVSDLDARKNYPINPNSAHYTNATPAQSGDRLVSNIRCPGDNPGNNANHDNHELIFGGGSGKFLAPPPDLFDPWQYYNGTDGIYFWTETDKTDAFITAALEKLDDNFSECEADVIDAVTGGAAIDLDSAATADTQCPANHICFRVRMITNSATAEWNGDTDGDEGGC